MITNRRKAVPAATFLAAVIAGSRAGKTNEEVAKELEMDVKSLGVRLSKTRSDIESDKMVKTHDKDGNAVPFTAEEKTKLYAALELKRSGSGGRPSSNGEALANVINDQFADLLK